MNELTDLELLFLSIANSRLIPARYIGFTGKKYTFEALKKTLGGQKTEARYFGLVVSRLRISRLKKKRY